MNQDLPTVYPLLTQEQKDQVEAARILYNGISLDEVFTDSEDFFYAVYRAPKTHFYHIRRVA